MLGGGTRDARRTERYLDSLMAGDDRRASAVPADTDLDPAIGYAARELRAGLTRVHPSFRFEESLAARLAAGAVRLKAGLPAWDDTGAGGGTVAPFRGRSAGGAGSAADAAVGGEPDTESTDRAAGVRATWPAAAFRRFPDMATRRSRPLIVGGVGVASAAISIGAVYVAWRHAHPASGGMGRAARAAHSRAFHSGHGGSHGRRPGVIDGILGVVS